MHTHDDQYPQPGADAHAQRNARTGHTQHGRLAALDAEIAALVAEFDALQAAIADDADADDVPVRAASSIHQQPEPASAPVPAGYRRDRIGRWRRTTGAAFVPGARDITLATVVPHTRGRGVVYVPTAVGRVWPVVADLLVRYPVAIAGAAPCFEVDEADWDAGLAATVVGVAAPELAIGFLLDTTAVAAVLNVAPRTVSSYRARNRLPAPAGHLCGGPVWTLPAILAHRLHW